VHICEAHTLPQAPQLFASLVGSTHAAYVPKTGHESRPPVQPVHLPAEQD
jgi:hypothetical protein